MQIFPDVLQKSTIKIQYFIHVCRSVRRALAATKKNYILANETMSCETSFLSRGSSIRRRPRTPITDIDGVSIRERRSSAPDALFLYFFLSPGQGITIFCITKTAISQWLGTSSTKTNISTDQLITWDFSAFLKLFCHKILYRKIRKKFVKLYSFWHSKKFRAQVVEA